MKRNVLLGLLCLVAMTMVAKPNSTIRIDRAEPLHWWTDMKCPLTLMLHGQDLAGAQVTIAELKGNKIVKGACEGLVYKSQHDAQSPNYLFVDLDVNQAGTYRITLTKNGKSASWD